MIKKRLAESRSWEAHFVLNTLLHLVIDVNISANLLFGVGCSERAVSRRFRFPFGPLLVLSRLRISYRNLEGTFEFEGCARGFVCQSGSRPYPKQPRACYWRCRERARTLIFSFCSCVKPPTILPGSKVLVFSIAEVNFFPSSPPNNALASIFSFEASIKSEIARTHLSLDLLKVKPLQRRKLVNSVESVLWVTNDRILQQGQSRQLCKLCQSVQVSQVRDFVIGEYKGF